MVFQIHSNIRLVTYSSIS